MLASTLAYEARASRMRLITQRKVVEVKRPRLRHSFDLYHIRPVYGNGA